MRHHPTIEVTCDRCPDSSEIFELCSLTRNSYDCRYLNDELKAAGWVHKDGEDLCSVCVDELRDDKMGEDEDDE